MITLTIATPSQFDQAQALVTEHHYLRRPVDDRCSPMAYCVWHERRSTAIGVLIVGRPEATRCFDGALTYGSLKDVADGRAQYDRWEVLNLARVWLHPCVQRDGALYGPQHLPGYVDRRGVWRSTLASMVIGELLGCVGYDYLTHKPPVFPNEPYEIKVLLSYCDREHHKGTIYRASGFALARTNERGLETWFTTDVAPLTTYQHDQIRKAAWRSPRGVRLRARRVAVGEQLRLEGTT